MKTLNRAGKTVSVCVLGATFETGNMGVSALASGILTVLLSSFDQPTITFVDYARTPKTYVRTIDGVERSFELLNIRFSRRLLQNNHIVRLLVLAAITRVFPIARFRRDLFARNDLLKRLASSDFVTSVAGGDSFSDIYGFSRFIYVALPQILAILLGCRLIQMPQTFGPFKGRVTKLIARAILKHSARVYCRDKVASADESHLAAMKQSSEFGYDMGFFLSPTPPRCEELIIVNRLKESGCLVGVNISSLLLHGGYNGNNMFSLKEDYSRVVKAILARLALHQRINILLIPHVYGPKGAADNDVEACQTIFEALEPALQQRVMVSRERYNEAEVKYIIGQCDMFIGSRMHACIAAVSQGIPAVSLAYSDKFSGVMESVGMKEFVVDLRSATVLEVLSLVERTLEGRTTIHAKLTETMAGVRSQRVKLFDDESRSVV